jgi:hypothetical protein
MNINENDDWSGILFYFLFCGKKNISFFKKFPECAAERKRKK